MSLLHIVASVLVVALLASLAPALSRRPDAAPVGGHFAFALRLFAVVTTVLVAAVVAWLALQQETGAFLLVLVGVPLAAALAVLGLSLTRRPSAVVTWVAAGVMLGWSLLTGLGAGLFFLVPAAVMLVAAVASTRDARKLRPLGPGLG